MQMTTDEIVLREIKAAAAFLDHREWMEALVATADGHSLIQWIHSFRPVKTYATAANSYLAFYKELVRLFAVVNHQLQALNARRALDGERAQQEQKRNQRQFAMERAVADRFVDLPHYCCGSLALSHP